MPSASPSSVASTGGLQCVQQSKPPVEMYMEIQQLKVLARRLRDMLEAHALQLPYCHYLDLIASLFGIEKWTQLLAAPEKAAGQELGAEHLQRLHNRILAKTGLAIDTLSLRKLLLETVAVEAAPRAASIANTLVAQVTALSADVYAQAVQLARELSESHQQWLATFGTELTEAKRQTYLDLLQLVMRAAIVAEPAGIYIRHSPVTVDKDFYGHATLAHLQTLLAPFDSVANLEGLGAALLNWREKVQRYVQGVAQGYLGCANLTPTTQPSYQYWIEKLHAALTGLRESLDENLFCDLCARIDQHLQHGEHPPAKLARAAGKSAALPVAQAAPAGRAVTIAIHQLSGSEGLFEKLMCHVAYGLAETGARVLLIETFPDEIPHLSETQFEGLPSLVEQQLTLMQRVHQRRSLRTAIRGSNPQVIYACGADIFSRDGRLPRWSDYADAALDKSSVELLQEILERRTAYRNRNAKAYPWLLQQIEKLRADYDYIVFSNLRGKNPLTPALLPAVDFLLTTYRTTQSINSAELLALRDLLRQAEQRRQGVPGSVGLLGELAPACVRREHSIILQEFFAPTTLHWLPEMQRDQLAECFTKTRAPWAKDDGRSPGRVNDTAYKTLIRSLTSLLGAPAARTDGSARRAGTAARRPQRSSR